MDIKAIYGINEIGLNGVRNNVSQILRRIDAIEQNIEASIKVNGVETSGVNETNAMHVSFIEDNLQVIKVLLSGIKELNKEVTK